MYEYNQYFIAIRLPIHNKTTNNLKHLGRLFMKMKSIIWAIHRIFTHLHFLKTNSFQLFQFSPKHLVNRQNS